MTTALAVMFTGAVTVGAVSSAQAAPGDYTTHIIAAPTVGASDQLKFTVRVSCPEGACVGAKAPKVTINVPEELRITTVGDASITAGQTPSSPTWGQSVTLQLIDTPQARLYEFTGIMTQDLDKTVPESVFSISANESSTTVRPVGSYDQRPIFKAYVADGSDGRRVDYALNAHISDGFRAKKVRIVVPVPDGAQVVGTTPGNANWAAAGSWRDGGDGTWIWESNGSVPRGDLQSSFGLESPRIVLDYDGSAWPVGSTPTLRPHLVPQDVKNDWRAVENRQTVTSPRIAAAVTTPTSTLSKTLSPPDATQVSAGDPLAYIIKASYEAPGAAPVPARDWTLVDAAKSGDRFFDFAALTHLSLRFNYDLQQANLPYDLVATVNGAETTLTAGNTGDAIDKKAVLSTHQGSGKNISALRLRFTGDVPAGAQVEMNLTGTWRSLAWSNSGSSAGLTFTNCLTATAASGPPEASACAPGVTVADGIIGNVYFRGAPMQSAVGTNMPAAGDSSQMVFNWTGDPQRPMRDYCAVVVLPVGYEYVDWAGLSFGSVRPKHVTEVSTDTVTDANGLRRVVVRLCVDSDDAAATLTSGGPYEYYKGLWARIGYRTTTEAFFAYEMQQRNVARYRNASLAYGYLVDRDEDYRSMRFNSAGADVFDLDPVRDTIPVGSQGAKVTGASELYVDSQLAKPGTPWQRTPVTVTPSEPTVDWQLFVFNNMTYSTRGDLCIPVPAETTQHRFVSDLRVVDPLTDEAYESSAGISVEYTSAGTDCSSVADGDWSTTRSPDATAMRFRIDDLGAGRAVRLEFSSAFVPGAAAGDTAVLRPVGVMTSDDGAGNQVPVGGFEFDPLTAVLAGAPGIEIAKYVNGRMSADPANPYLVAEDTPVSWSYLVRNSGNVDLEKVTVADVLAGTSDPAATVTCPATTLAAGASMTCTSDEQAAVAGAYANTATATGTEAGTETVVSDSDTSHYFGVVRGLGLTVRTNGQETPAAPGVEVSSGSTVGWTYTVTNTGNIALRDITVDHPGLPDGAALTCPAATLAAGDSMDCEASGVPGDGQHSDDVQASANDEASFGGPLTASGISHYFVAKGGLAVAKTTNGFAVTDDADAPKIRVGGPVTWAYEITNTGNVAVDGLSISDVDTDGNPVTPIDCDGEPIGSLTLDPDESVTCTASGTATEGDYANTVTVAGTAGIAGPVTATDTSAYFGATEGVSLQVTVNGRHVADASTRPVVPTGSTVEWVYTVANNSNSALLDPRIEDAGLPTGVVPTCEAVPTGGIPVGGTWTCRAEGGAGDGDSEGVGRVDATVAATDAAVSDTDGWWLRGADAAIDASLTINSVTARAPEDAPYVAAGSGLAWELTVNNTGGVPITDVALATSDGEPLWDTITCEATTLDVGESTTCTALSVAAAGPHLSQVTVTGQGVFTDTQLAVEPAVDVAHYVGVTTGLSVVAKVNGVVVPSPADADYFRAGGTAPVTFDVTNDGNTTVDGLELAAAQGEVRATTTDGPREEFTCSSTSIDPGETVTCSADVEVREGLTEVVGAARGDAPSAGTVAHPETSVVEASGATWYFGEKTALSVTATIDGRAATTQGAALAFAVGTDKTVSYVVTNTSNVPLSAVTVVDSTGIRPSCPADVIPAGGHVVCSAALTTASGTVQHQVSASGISTTGLRVDAQTELWRTSIAVPIVPQVPAGPDQPVVPHGNGSAANVLPWTGAQVAVVALLALALAGLGVALVRVRRRGTGG